MKPVLICLLFILPWPALAEFAGVYSGMLDIRHQYLTDAIHVQEQVYGAGLNMQSYRRKPTGWMSRGPRLHIEQSMSGLSIDSHVSLYQPYVHQGFWFQFQWQKHNFDSQLSENEVYLNQSGTASSLAAGDDINLGRQYFNGQIYWYESIKDEGPINTAGIFYAVETSPVNAEISSTNATVFDGVFSGFGFTLGRIKDDRGLNFQWRLTLAQLDSDLSNDATNHRSLSSLESTVYQLKIRLDWHYRHYIAPYWYVVPSLHLSHENLLQSQLDPQFVDHKQFNFTQLSVLLGIRRYF